MSTAIKLSNKLMDDAKIYANVYHRSIPKQIEYWSQIGKLVEENPDLSFSFIKNILFSKEEILNKNVEPYNLLVKK